MTKGYKNLDPLRKKLQRLHRSGMVENRIGAAIERGATAVERHMKSIIPTASGRLRDMTSYKMSSDKLAAKVGPGAALMNVVANYRRDAAKKGAAFAPTARRTMRVKSVEALFYFRFLDSGVKAHTVKASKQKKVLADGRAFFGKEVRIPARAPMHIKSRAFDRNRDLTIDAVRKEVIDTLIRASRS